MPYTISQETRDDGTVYCVYRADDAGEPQGDTLGCHDTQDEAAAQIGAIEENEGKSEPFGEPAPTKEQLSASLAYLRTGIIRKVFAVKALERNADGGKIRVSTMAPDRIGDRMFPRGARLENYMKNPVVQYGHVYDEPWATIGNTKNIEVADDSITVDFALRPAANEADPQNIVRLLWAGGWVKTASIGFQPIVAEPNDTQGTDHKEWDMLEWSMVPVPMNPDALAMAMKAAEIDGPLTEEHMLRTLGTLGIGRYAQKEGRVLSAKDHEMFSGIAKDLRAAVKAIESYLNTNAPEPKAMEAAAPDTETTTVTAAPVFQPLSEEALSALREFGKQLMEVSNV